MNTLEKILFFGAIGASAIGLAGRVEGNTDKWTTKHEMHYEDRGNYTHAEDWVYTIDENGKTVSITVLNQDGSRSDAVKESKLPKFKSKCDEIKFYLGKKDVNKAYEIAHKTLKGTKKYNNCTKNAILNAYKNKVKQDVKDNDGWNATIILPIQELDEVKIADWECYSMIVLNSGKYEDRKKYFNKACSLDRNKTIEYLKKTWVSSELKDLETSK